MVSLRAHACYYHYDNISCQYVVVVVAVRCMYCWLSLSSSHHHLSVCIVLFFKLCFFNVSVAGFVFGMGVRPEIDLMDAGQDMPDTLATEVKSEADGKAEQLQQAQKLVELLDRKTNAGMSDNQDANNNNNDDDDAFESAAGKNEAKLDSVTAAISAVGAAQYGTDQHKMVYENFDVRAKDYTTFFTHDFSWEDQGFELVERNCAGVAPLLGQLFTSIYELTYKTVNQQQGVDTTPFRRAIWYYTHRLYGIAYDDYEYREVNKLLHVDIKTFCKLVACTPTAVTYKHFRSLGYDFAMHERAHIALLAVFAHQKSALLYILNAFANT
jgi:sestrin 1/3